MIQRDGKWIDTSAHGSLHADKKNSENPNISDQTAVGFVDAYLSEYDSRGGLKYNGGFLFNNSQLPPEYNGNLQKLAKGLTRTSDS